MDNDSYLWPLSSSPLFVPQSSPSPSPSAFTYQSNMRRRKTASPARQRSGKLTVQLDRTRSNVGAVQQHQQQEQSHSTLSASASGSGSGSGSGPGPGSRSSGDAATSSASSTPQSSFSLSGSLGSELEARARDKRPASVVTSAGRVHSRRQSRQESEAREGRANKRRRIVMQPYDPLSVSDSEDSLFGIREFAHASYASLNGLFGEEDGAMESAAPPMIDLTDDIPRVVAQSRDRSTGQRVRQLSPQTTAQTSRAASMLGSRTEPILIDDLDSPLLSRTRSVRPVSIPPPLSQEQHREPSIEILDTIVARQQEDAVAAQSTGNEETFTTFGNMNCVICMDKPRNLSMVPCGHVFCGACITEALRHSESRIHEHTGQRKAACPVCRETIYRGRKEHIVPILLKKSQRRQAVR